jgi:hypothetical protein
MLPTGPLKDKLRGRRHMPCCCYRSRPAAAQLVPRRSPRLPERAVVRPACRVAAWMGRSASAKRRQKFDPVWTGSSKGTRMRRSWFTVLAAFTLVVGVGASTATASASVSPKVLAQFKKVYGPFAVANIKWSDVLEGPNANLEKISKACAAFVPDIKAFDEGLHKIAFTGKTATDMASLIKLNNQSLPILSHVTSLKTFEKQYVPLTARYVSLQVALGKDLGIPAADLVL